MKILGYDYRITADEDSGFIEGYGRHVGKRHLIQIASDIPLQQKESTILHEIIEILNYYLELKMAHSAIMALEASLYQVLSANGVDLSPLTALIEKGCPGEHK